MIEFRQLSVRYANDGSTHNSGSQFGPKVLDDVTFTIPEGDLTLLIGRTGSGKSTLLNTINGLIPWFSGGEISGEVVVDGRSTKGNRPRDMADLVGYVAQNPLTSFVTDTVEDEIAYGMEQLNLSEMAMRKRVEETLDLLDIASLRRRPLLSLSGGQQQRVAIAAVLAIQPKVLVLDEPTSALDPTAAQDVLAAIVNLVQDTGLTVVLAEHRLERVMRVADKAAWLPGNGSVVFGPTAEVLAKSDVVPPLGCLAKRLGWQQVPLSVRQARRRVRKENISVCSPQTTTPPDRKIVCRLEKLSVKYGQVLAVNSVSTQFHAGEVTALMGRNGAGKSSLMWAIQGGVASSGSVWVQNSDPRTLSPSQARHLVSLVPQTAADLLYLETVKQECDQADQESGAEHGSTWAILEALGADLSPQMHPRDLSEGQRLALVLAIQLAATPALVLLDEPTRGLDYSMKTQLAKIVKDLAAGGRSVVISTHDVEFAASASDRTVIMAEGDIVADGSTREVCTSSPAYSPQISKVFRPIPVLDTEEVLAGLVDRREIRQATRSEPGKDEVKNALR